MRPVLESIDVEFVAELYRVYLAGLKGICAAPRTIRDTPAMKDELTCLLVRHFRPESVTEVGTLYGWSTTWILQALRDNGSGSLESYDPTDDAVRAVPLEQAEGRWEFRHGDVRTRDDDWAAKTGVLFVDAAYNASFTRWYMRHLLPTAPTVIPVS